MKFSVACTVIPLQSGPSVVSGIEISASFPIIKKIHVVGGIASLDVSAVTANHSIATSASTFQPESGASHSLSPSAGPGILSEHRGNESA